MLVFWLNCMLERPYVGASLLDSNWVRERRTPCERAAPCYVRAGGERVGGKGAPAESVGTEGTDPE